MEMDSESEQSKGNEGDQVLPALGSVCVYVRAFGEVPLSSR